MVLQPVIATVAAIAVIGLLISLILVWMLPTRQPLSCSLHESSSAQTAWSVCNANTECPSGYACRDSGNGQPRCLTEGDCRWAAGIDRTESPNNCSAIDVSTLPVPNTAAWASCNVKTVCPLGYECRNSGNGQPRCLKLNDCRWAEGADRTTSPNNCLAVSDPELGSVCLVTHQGKYLTIDEHGGVTLADTRGSGGMWDLSTGRAAKSSVGNRWISRDPNGYDRRGGVMVVTEDLGRLRAILEWIDDDYVAFRQDNKYISEDGGRLIWDRTSAGAWERFRVLIPGKEVCLKTIYNQYLAVTSFGTVSTVPSCPAMRWTLDDGPKMRGRWLERANTAYGHPTGSTTKPTGIEMLFRGNTVSFRKGGRYLYSDSLGRLFWLNETQAYNSNFAYDRFEIVDPSTLPPPVSVDPSTLQTYTCTCSRQYCGNGGAGGIQGVVRNNLSSERVQTNYGPCNGHGYDTGWICRNGAGEMYPCAL